MPEALLDILTLVSSDRRFPLELTQLMATGELRLVHTFRTGSECLRALTLDDPATRRLVLIDKIVSDISPANLCDAIRCAHPSLGIVMVVEQDDVEGVQRAMLAGAKATISRQASIAELSCVLERVIESSTTHALMQMASADNLAAGTAQLRYDLADYGHRGVLIPFIGARGGAGRSTLSSSLAYLAAEAHIDTALIDFDLQFGDLSFLFGATPGTASSAARQQEESLYASRQHTERQHVGRQHAGQRQHTGSLGEEDDLLAFLQEASQGHTALKVAGNLRKFGKQLAPNLRLYAPRAAAEKVESLVHLLPAALESLRSEHELLLVNTGAYWTLFHAELLEQSDLAICVFDQTVIGVRATTELREMCRRLGIPSARLLFVMNRARSLGLRPSEAAEVLLADKVYCIHDAGTELSALFDSGDFTQLLQQTSFMAELYELLDEIAIRSDLCIHDALSLRFAMRREGGTRLTAPSLARRSGARKKGLLRRA